jgi:hypothetical protein
MCDHGCDAYFEVTKVTIIHTKKVMLTGKYSTGAICKLLIIDPYLPPLEPTRPPPTENKEVVNRYVNAALNHEAIVNRIACYYASLFSPVIST